MTTAKSRGGDPGPQNINAAGGQYSTAVVPISTENAAFGIAVYPPFSQARARLTGPRARERTALRGPVLPDWARCIICYGRARNGRIAHSVTCADHRATGGVTL